MSYLRPFICTTNAVFLKRVCNYGHIWPDSLSVLRADEGFTSSNLL